MERHPPHRITERLDVRICGSAAASENGRSRLHQCNSCLCKLLRCHAVNGLFLFDRRRLPLRKALTLHQLRQPCIGLCHNRHSGILCHLTNRLHHLHRTCGTVDSNSIHSQRLQHNNRGLRLRAKKCSSILIVGERHHNRQIAHLADCKYCCPGFLQTHHGLHYKEIHACLTKHPRLLLIYLHQFLKHQLAHRVKLLPGHGHITGNQRLFPHSFSRELHQLPVHLLQSFSQAVFLQLNPVRCKRRSIDNITPRLHIVPLQIQQYLGILQHPAFRADSDRHACLHEIRSCRAIQNNGACFD